MHQVVSRTLVHTTPRAQRFQIRNDTTFIAAVRSAPQTAGK